MAETSPGRSWQARPLAADPAALARELGVPEVLAAHLSRRGIGDAQAAAGFLSPRLADLADPRQMAGMDAAVARLVKAIQSGEKVALYGDYDVDGVTSTTLMAEVLHGYGLDPLLHIPHRIKDGYGLNHAAVADLKHKGATLLVTLDCGVTAVEEVRRAVETGVEVLVIDHHTVPVELPPAVAVLNPHRPDCRFPYKALCAVGVTFFLCVALRAALREQGLPGVDLRQFLDLVALGTVADLVPLTGQNRILVSQGLKVLARAERVGMRALLEVSRLDPAHITASSLGYQLGPRINAAGRLQEAMLGVRLLLSRDPREALDLARQLDGENVARRQVEQDTVTQAVALVEADALHRNANALVLADERWHPGVVGIAAQKLVERYHRPSILIGATGIGSGRSIEAFHLHDALAAAAGYLRGFGGHAHAAGLRIGPENVDAFRQALYLRAQRMLTREDLTPRAHHDGPLPLEQVTPETVEALERAAPFGRGNAEPCFVVPAVQVAGVRVVGQDHLQLDLGGGRRGIAFRQAGRAPELDAPADLLATPEFDCWRGSRRLNLRVRDFRPAAKAAP